MSFIRVVTAQIIAASLTIFSSSFVSLFLFAVFKLHHRAGSVLTCSNHTITYSHVHSSTHVGVMSMKETGTVLVFPD